jgi:hypothetical protein
MWFFTDKKFPSSIGQEDGMCLMIWKSQSSSVYDGTQTTHQLRVVLIAGPALAAAQIAHLAFEGTTVDIREADCEN